MTAGAAPRRVLVAGTAGGVGTTTTVALIFQGLRDRAPASPVLLDHTAGELGLRLADGDEVRSLDEQQVLHDLGPRASDVGVPELSDHGVLLVLVAAATPVGVLLASEAVVRIRTAYGRDGVSRTVVVLAGVNGSARLGRAAVELTSATDLRGVVVFPPDLALAAGGRVPVARLSRRTRRAATELVQLLSAGRRATEEVVAAPGDRSAG